VHNIDSYGCESPENWEKNFGPLPQERNPRISDQRFTQYNQRGGTPNRGCGRGRDPYTFRPPYCMFHNSETNHRTKDYLPHIPRVQKKNGPRIHPAFAAKGTQRSKPHYAMGSPPPVIFSILPFTLPTTSLPKQSSPSPGLLPIIPLCHNQPSTTFINSTNNISSGSATNHMPNAKKNPILKSRKKPTLRHHLRYKSKNPRSSLKPSPPMAQSSQFLAVQTLILTPKDSVEITIEK
jgi:hypothetical protein